MLKIGRKKEASKRDEMAKAKGVVREDREASLYVGAFPEKPWEHFTRFRHGRRFYVKHLSEAEQKEAVLLAKKYFGFKQNDFPRARIKIQDALDNPEEREASSFFKSASFPEKRLAIKAYLSNAGGRFIREAHALKLLRHIADAGLDFEVGAVNYVIEGAVKTEIVVGDASEVSINDGYWLAHTHPAKTGITNNFLPSVKDIDVIISTARSEARNLSKYETVNYVFRDIGESKVTVTTSVSSPPSTPVINSVKIGYHLKIEMDKTIDEHLNAIRRHLKTRHHLRDDQIEIMHLET